MEGKAQGAKQDEHVAKVDAADAIRKAKQVDAAHGDRYGEDDLRAQFFTKEHREERHENDVERGQKAAACLCRGALGVKHQAKLLEIDAQGQKQTANKTADQHAAKLFFVLWEDGCRGLEALEIEDRAQKEDADEGSKAIEQEGRDGVRQGALHHKGKAPYEGCGAEDQAALQILIAFHTVTRLSFFFDVKIVAEKGRFVKMV